MIRPTLMAIFDSVKDEMTIATPVRPAPGVGAREAYDAALKRLHTLVARLDEPLPHAPAARLDTLALPEPASNTSEAEYLAMVGKAKEYIKAGDIFQVVLSQRFSAPFSVPCAVSIPRRVYSTSISRVSRLWGPRRKSSFACVMAK
jgi:anthranilate synthase component 1